MAASAAMQAGSSIYGAKKAEDAGEVDTNELFRPFVNPYADPAYNASLTGILSMLGAPDTTSTIQASPFQQVLNQMNVSGGLREEDARDVRGAMAVAQAITQQMAAQGVTDPGVVWNAIESNVRGGFGDNGSRIVNQMISAIGAGGFSGPADLVQRQMAFAQQASDYQSQLDAIRPTVQAGRMAALENIARLMQDFPSYTKGDIDAASQTERQRMRESVLQAANVGGFNPAAGLAEVERDPNPILNAVALLSGANSIGVNSLAALNAGLLDPIQAATSLSNVGLSASLQQMSTAAQQAAQMYGQNQNAGALGTGITNAGNQLGSGLQTLAFMDMFNQAKTQPAAKPTPTSQYAVGGRAG